MKWLRHILPHRYVWVEWRWGSVSIRRRYRVKDKKEDLYVYYADELHWLRRSFKWNGHEEIHKSSLIKRWAPYRAWWQTKLPPQPDPDDEYKIKINERARQSCGSFPPS